MKGESLSSFGAVRRQQQHHVGLSGGSSGSIIFLRRDVHEVHFQ